MDFNIIKIQTKRLLRLTLFLSIFVLVTVCLMPCFTQTCTGNTNQIKYDIIIVLGNPATNDCKPAPLMKERVNKGIELFKNGTAPKILFTGSSVGNKCNEAEVMADYAISMGIADSCIIKESQALNTYQNAFYSVTTMEKLGLKSAAIVTSEFHVKRACNVFSNYGINYSMFSSKIPTEITKIKAITWKVRENILLSYHIIFGYNATFGLKK